MIVSIFGGLGNQLFQYAFARNLLKKGKKVKIDNSVLLGSGSRKYGLDKFDIKLCLAGKEECAFALKIKNNRFLRRLEKIKPLGIRKYYCEKSDIVYDINVERISDEAYLEGYWQNERYFSECQDELRQELVLGGPIGNEAKRWLEELTRCPSVSLHIRRGDYVSKKNILEQTGVMPLEYYEKSLKHINGKVVDPVIFIFSDEIEWAKCNLNISNKHFFVSSGGALSDYEELFLMSQCKHNIIANSTFSWWGAWLNDNQNKIVIAPRNWAKIPHPRSENIIPKQWIRM